jgi:hypothetical protein
MNNPRHTPRTKRLFEAHAIVRSTRSALSQIDKLKIRLLDRNQFANELGAAHEALEMLRVKIQSVALKARGES